MSFLVHVHYDCKDIYKTNQFDYPNKRQHTLYRLGVFSLVVFDTCNTFALPSFSR